MHDKTGGEINETWNFGGGQVVGLNSAPCQNMLSVQFKIGLCGLADEGKTGLPTI